MYNYLKIIEYPLSEKVSTYFKIGRNYFPYSIEFFNKNFSS